MSVDMWKLNNYKELGQALGKPHNYELTWLLVTDDVQREEKGV